MAGGVVHRSVVTVINYKEILARKKKRRVLQEKCWTWLCQVWEWIECCQVDLAWVEGLCICFRALQLTCRDLNFGTSLFVFVFCFYYYFSSPSPLFSISPSDTYGFFCRKQPLELIRRMAIRAGAMLWPFNGIGIPLEKEPQSKVLTWSSIQGLIHLSRITLCNTYV